MLINKLSIALIIPTLNAERDDWHNILQAIQKQSLQPDHKLILDSSSSDNTVSIGQEYGFEIHPVKAGTFDHASTRKWGISLVTNRADVVIFMTQDALLNNKDSFKNLITGFSDEKIAVIYGRQLPRKNAGHIETFGRLQNYPQTSETRSIDDKSRLGMTVAFNSDAFAAYNIHLINQFNAFPDRSIVSEDYITAGRMLLNGYKVHYEALATVEHSHDFNLIHEFKRYFDIGVSHDEFKGLIAKLGATEKAGGYYLWHELLYLYRHKPFHIPLSLIRTASKYFGYKVGKLHRLLPRLLKIKLSRHGYYFANKEALPTISIRKKNPDN